jgi:CheY-like chemotaxis protein
MNTNGTPVILVAEDDANDVFFLKRAFNKAEIGCKIVDVPNGQMVIDYLSGVAPYDNRSQYPLPQLLLLDLKMPLMSGFEVLEWLQNHPEIGEVPALVLSSSAHQEDVVKAQALGARDYHVKPSDQHQLVELVRELQTKWIGHRMAAP